MNDHKYIEPYRLFFPLGLFAAVTAVVPWLAFYFGLSSGYPLMLHARMMIMGFLMSFICGFLLTAVPKMTATFIASTNEVRIIFTLIVAQIFVSLLGFDQIGNFISIAQFLSIISFVLRRFSKRKQAGPMQLAFVPMGLASGLIGAFLIAFPSAVSPMTATWANKLLFQAFVLNLILGLGSRLVPALSRKNENFNPMLAKKESRYLVWLEVIFLNLTFAIEAFVSVPFGLLLRFIFVCFYLVTKFKIFKKPLESTTLGNSLNVASVFLVLPLLLLMIWPQVELALLHLLFVGGFAMITLMVSVRVTLAHGGFGLYLEKSSQLIWGTAIGLAGVALLRSLGPKFFANYHQSIIITSAILWMILIGNWALHFAKMYNKVKVSQC